MPHNASVTRVVVGATTSVKNVAQKKCVAYFKALKCSTQASHIYAINKLAYATCNSSNNSVVALMQLQLLRLLLLFQAEVSAEVRRRSCSVLRVWQDKSQQVFMHFLLLFFTFFFFV